MTDEITLEEILDFLNKNIVLRLKDATELSKYMRIEERLLQGLKLIKLVKEREQRTGNALVDLQNKLSPQSKPLLELENLIYKELLEVLEK